MGAVRPGDTLADRFRVEAVLGEGGMGVVVAAWHCALRTRVALKLLRAERASAEATERFLREAQAAAQLRSEHVARVLDVGTLPSGAPFLVMEYVGGTTLSELLARDGPLPVSDAVDAVLDACLAMAEAHARGIVHRDLKPSNLSLTARSDGSPLVKVLDFGIAKNTLDEAATLTGSAAVLGSPRYMSPEQIRDPRHVDARSDIWSLGVTLFELSTGRAPFEAYTASGVLAAIAADPPQPPGSYRPDLPPGLEKAILRCLEKDRELRFPTVGALALALAPFGGPTAQQRALSVAKTLDAPPLAPPPPAEPPPALSAQTSSSSVPWATAAPSPAPARPRRTALALAASLLALALAAGALQRARLSAPAPSQPAAAQAASPLASGASSAPPAPLSASPPAPSAAQAPASAAPAASSAPTRSGPAASDRRPSTARLPASAAPDAPGPGNWGERH